MRNFWITFKKPIYALAPMAGISDSAFRQICQSFGADAVFSEMISATAIVYNSKKTLELARFDRKAERPFVAQLFGSKPEHFAYAAEFITKKIKPDGLDINFGCPVKKVARQGAGAVLMNDLKLAREIVKAVLGATNLPVSIKCRSRVGAITVLDFLKTIKDLPVAAVMIHGRSLAQGHSGEVDFTIIKQARKYFSGIILANGGVKDEASAEEMLKKTEADGLGIGRGALGRPWIFKQFSIFNFQFSNKEIFETALKHTSLAHKLKGKQGIIEMRKHLCWYVRGLDNASELRKKLIQVESLSDVKNIIKSQITNTKLQTNYKFK
ncbi:MAG: tRNA-dihydrouridine synthase [Parcubacteria group bacterium]|nr:tRNA-dihydrouridine synthase [Parcubacteria group bacterium]